MNSWMHAHSRSKVKLDPEVESITRGGLACDFVKIRSNSLADVFAHLNKMFFPAMHRRIGQAQAEKVAAYGDSWVRLQLGVRCKRKERIVNEVDDDGVDGWDSQSMLCATVASFATARSCLKNEERTIYHVTPKRKSTSGTHVRWGARVRRVGCRCGHRARKIGEVGARDVEDGVNAASRKGDTRRFRGGGVEFFHECFGGGNTGGGKAVMHGRRWWWCRLG
ncbi:hypothetical protein B0H16DRAFT_1476418 [Mycena metata]|uniref:Uncharacterized protein n=1 Tax=Mycena metata TaxID=1033252 RepID=A0AAD7MGY9_9AGAR|nr:hypothetical protein B0H16DRAFT_1476418 [Mycena metata]